MNLQETISNKKWSSLIDHFSIEQICSSLNFKESMWLAKHLFFDDFCNDSNQQFALKLILKIKSQFAIEWQKDWKNDVFLGDICSLLWLYDDQYKNYKKAYDQLKDPPSSLLLLLASCFGNPDSQLINEEQAKAYLKKSLEKKITYESALMMKTFCEKKGEREMVAYWDKLYNELKTANVHADLIAPDIFKNP